MQATGSGAPSEPFLQQEIGGGIVGWFCLILGVMIDEVGAADFNISGTGSESCQCGYATFTCTGGGYQGERYTKRDDESIVLEQSQAGEGWLGLLIMALIFSSCCCIGTCKDYFDGDHDNFKPSDYYDGCPLMLANCGCTTIGIIGIIFWTLCGLFWYVGGETCSSLDFWEEYNNGVEDLVAYGGFSMALIILSIICFFALFGLVFYEKKAFGEIPKGDPIDIPIIGDALKARPKSNAGVPQTSPQAPVTAAPRPQAVPPKFSPTNNVTNKPSYKSNTTTTSTTTTTSQPKPPPTMSRPITGVKPKLHDPALMSNATGTGSAGARPKGQPPRPGGPPPVPKPKYQE